MFCVHEEDIHYKQCMTIMLIPRKIELVAITGKWEFLRILTNGNFWQNMEEFDCHME